MTSETIALSLILFAVSTLGILGLQRSGYDYAWLLGAITAAMVLIAKMADPLAAPSVACDMTVLK